MVKVPGKKAGPGPIRALNLPGLVEVEEDDARNPVAVSMKRRRLAVASIEDVWEVLDEWWRAKPISRRYYRLVMEEGPQVTLFWDLVDGRWYQQRG